MGSHKHKKKYESDSSSSESDASSSSNDAKSKKKKYSKKAKYSSSEESEKVYKPKSKPSDDLSKEKYKKKTRSKEPEERSSDRKYKERDQRIEKYKDKHEERYKDKDRHNNDRSRDRGKSGDIGKARDREKSRDKELEETRSRRDYNKEKYEDKDRYKRHDHRRDDWSFKGDGNSRKHRSDEGHRGRVREDRDRRNNRYENRGRRSSSFDHANAKWGKNDDKKSEKKDAKEKEKPNFGLTGKLTEETNTYKGIVIKYSEPPEARKPKRRWRLYPFKGEKALQTLYIHRESAYLIGRERKVVDLPVDHPSCSKQHAALQYRLVPFSREDGTIGKRVRPYLIDLDSANGTFINNKKIESRKYVELFEKDVIKFGFSSREYVLLHENSKDETMDDDVKQEEEIPVKEEPQ